MAAPVSCFRIGETWLAYNDSSFENNTIAPINEPDLFASLLHSRSSAGTPELKPTMQHHVDHEFVTMHSCLLQPPISPRTGYRKNCP
ncbi:hypothetical protein TNCV_3953211 [Trichonephila clavipes]|nr:hypothetical protein TNCV_3953211 [Trichonephila clavipes]